MADKGLELGLLTEFAAIYAYSVAGAQLSGDRQDTARANETAHRDRRDDIMVRLTEAGVDLPQEEAAYQLSTEVTDAETAAALITGVEQDTTRQWRGILAETDGDDRRVAIDAYASSAVTMARWKRALGESPSTTAFPGREK